MRRPTIVIWGLVASVWLHIGAAALVKRMPAQRTKNNTLVAVVEKKKPKKKEDEHKPKDEPKPPDPEPPKIVTPRPAPKPAPKAAEPPPAPVDAPKVAATPNAFAGTGLGGLPNVGNFSGMGIAVPQGGGGGDGVGDGAGTGNKPKTEAPKEKVLGAAPKDTSASGAAGAECAEDASKPKPTSMPQPAYSDEARAAEVEGVVTIRVMVDESGHVVDAQLVKGLGHGLDERALAAAKSWTFSPGMRCGKPAKSKFVMSMRFALGE